MSRRQPPTVRALSLCALALIAGAVHADPAPDPSEGPDEGPIRVRSAFLLSAGYLDFEPDDATILAPGAWHLEAALSAANTFAQSDVIERDLEDRQRAGQGRLPLRLEELRAFAPDEGDTGLFQIDGELQTVILRARRGLPRRFELAVTVPFLRFTGGLFDGTVERVHSELHFDQEGRDVVPRRETMVYLRSPHGEMFSTDASGWELGDVTFSGKRAFGAAGGRNRWAAEVRFKLPAGDSASLFGSGSVDTGARLLYSRQMARWRLHLNAGALRLGRHEALGIGSETIFATHLAIERRLTRRTTGVFQVEAVESPFRQLDVTLLSRSALGWTLGIKRLVHGATVALALSENVAAFDNSPDASLHLAVSRSFTPR